MGTGHVGRGRRVAAWVLLVLAVLLTPITIATRWVNFEVTSEDRFVNTLGPLAEDPEVQEAVAQRVTQVIFDAVDVQSLAQDALPDRAAFLAGPLASGVESFTEEQALAFVETEQFAQLWEDALRVAHRAADALLTGRDEGAFQVQDGEVVVDLSTIVQAVVDQLDERGLTFVENIPSDAVSGQIVLFESKTLAEAQTAVELLNTLSWVLLVVALGCFAVSIFLLGDARRGLVRAGLGLAVGALMQGVIMAVVRAEYLAITAGAGANRSVQEVVFDQLVASLRTTSRTVLVLGAVVALVAWLFGPSSPAVWVRTVVSGGIGRGAEGAGSLGVAQQPALAWVGRHERGLDVAVLALAALVFLTRDQPSPTTVLLIALVAAVLVGVVAVLARVGRAQDPDGGAASQRAEGADDGSAAADSAADVGADAPATDSPDEQPSDEGASDDDRAVT